MLSNKLLVRVFQILFVLMLVGTIILGVWLAVGHQIDTSPKVARKSGSPIPVKVEIIDEGEVRQLIAAEGFIKESSEIYIRAKSDSEILSVNANLGGVGTKGQTLVLQDTTLQSSEHDVSKVMYERSSSELKI